MTEYEIMNNKDIQSRIYTIRNVQVMLDSDLAKLYGVETKVLNQAVKRNAERFPPEFSFQLTAKDANLLRSQPVTLINENSLRFQSGTSKHESNLKSQFVTSSWGGVRKQPHVFTEHCILMLSSVLNSDRAIQVNIHIMRTFTKLRQMLSTHEELKTKIESIEKKYDSQFRIVFDAIKELITEDLKPEKKIGFERNSRQ